MTIFFKLGYCVNWEGRFLFSWFKLPEKKKATNRKQQTKTSKKAGPLFLPVLCLKTYSSMNETSPNNCIPPGPRELTYFISIYNEKNKYQNLNITVTSILLPLHYYFFKLILESCRLQFPALCRRSPHNESEFTNTRTHPAYTYTHTYIFHGITKDVISVILYSLCYTSSH